MNRSEIGKLGEDIAARHLERAGYRIFARNYLIKGIGELDIAAKDKSGILVFVEVKTMTPGLLKPEDQYSANKRQKMTQACEAFVAKHPELLNERSGWQMDLVAIELPDPEVPGEPKIRHYRNL